MIPSRGECPVKLMPGEMNALRDECPWEEYLLNKSP